MDKIIAFALLLFTLPAIAAIQSKAVTYEHEGTTLTGYLYWDDAIKGKRPGVMVIHEWWGLDEYAKKRARMLAEEGYVGFAADMYGDNRLATNPEQAKEWMMEVTADVEGWQERAALGLKQLVKSGMVDAERTAAMGYCFGGGTILQMAYSGTKAKGVVGYHASLPAAPESANGKIDAKVLIFHGAADPFVAPEVIANFKDKIQAAGADWEFVTYGGDVRHSFTVPTAAERGMEAIKYDADADRDSWQRTMTFYANLFAK